MCHDPGDEHPGGNTVGGIVGFAFACPFCGCNLSWCGGNKRHQTPLAIQLPWRDSSFDACLIPDRMDYSYDVLDTCSRPDCMTQARKFAEQNNMSRMKKQRDVFWRWHRAPSP